jgi:hypothetical protein
MKQLLTLVLINVSLFHGETPLVSAAAPLPTAPKLCHGRKPDGSLNRGVSPFFSISLIIGGNLRLENPYS